MTVYVVAQLTFTQVAAYRRYQQKFMDVFSQYTGDLLAADEAPCVEEGTWHGDKIVLLRFPSIQAYRAWAESPEYTDIVRDRRAGADAVVLVVNGMPA